MDPERKTLNVIWKMPTQSLMKWFGFGQRPFRERSIRKGPSFLDKDIPNDEPITKVNALPLVPPPPCESTRTLGEVIVLDDVRID
jgi:hypothetical protein